MEQAEYCISLTMATLWVNLMCALKRQPFIVGDDLDHCIHLAIQNCNCQECCSPFANSEFSQGLGNQIHASWDDVTWPTFDCIEWVCSVMPVKTPVSPANLPNDKKGQIIYEQDPIHHMYYFMWNVHSAMQHTLHTVLWIQFVESKVNYASLHMHLHGDHFLTSEFICFSIHLFHLIMFLDLCQIHIETLLPPCFVAC